MPRARTSPPKQRPSGWHGQVPLPVATPKNPRSLQLTIHASLGKSFVPFLRTHLRRAHALLPSTRLTDLSLAIVDDATMSRLHLQFMNIPTPTDVLTFPLDESDDGLPTTGEVVVCLPEARRRAREEGVPLKNELLLYALHGLLHLSGFDDRTARDYRRMHQTEDRILSSLGIGPTFMPSRKPASAPKKSSRTITRRNPGRRTSP